MPEIDHSQIDAEAAPEPAKAITADRLLELERAQRRRFLVSEDDAGMRIRVGHEELDDYVLGGGVERGVVLGISAGSGSGAAGGQDGSVEGRLISLHLLTSILTSRLSSGSKTTKPVATIIDTTGSFPVQLLAEVISSRLGKGREGDVAKLLQLVSISRVFDLEGLWEVLGEVPQKNLSVLPDSGNQAHNEAEREVLEIGDSDDEEDVKEVLLGREDVVDEGIEVIVIDNMTHIINELFSRKEKSSAHNLLTILTTHLRTLTRTNNILTILHNTTISPASKPSSTSHQKDSQSVFSTTAQKPSLGRIFAQFPDLHLLVSPQPRGRADAELLYGGNDEDDQSNEQARRRVRYCFILEVLKDECPNLDDGSKSSFGKREERWMAFEREKKEGVGFASAFRAKEHMMGLGTAKGGVTADVGAIAKIYGFGGRRV